MFFGKYLSGYPRPDNPSYVPPGWDEWHGSNADPVVYFNQQITENGRVVLYGSDPAD